MATGQTQDEKTITLVGTVRKGSALDKLLSRKGAKA